MGGKRDARKKKAKQTGEKKVAKNPTKEKSKKKSKSDEPVEDIDALLETFRRQQLETFAVHHEANCDPPSRRVGASFTVSTVKPEEIVLFGGEYFDGSRTEMYNDHYVFNAEKNEWRKVTCPNSPGPRSSHQAVATNNGLLFLFGGEFISPNETNFFHYKDFWMLDLKSQQWEKLEIRSRPSPRSGHRMVLWKHYLVLFGGFFDQVHDTKYLDDLWVFDTQEFKWTQINVLEKPTPRSGFQFMTHNDEIYLYGGYSRVKVKGKKVAGVMHTDCWVLKMNLDISAIRFERKRKVGGIVPGARSGCTTAYHKGKGFLFGGVSDIIEGEETIESEIHSDFFQLNLDSNKFYPIQINPKKGQDPNSFVFPGARFNQMMAITNKTLYMFGGIIEKGKKELTLCDFWSINIEKLNEWTCIIKDGTLEKDWLGEEDSDSEEDDDTNSQQDSDEEGGSEEEEEALEEEDQDEKSLESDIVEIEPLADPEQEPKAGEKMGEYFDRTQPFWLGVAMEDGRYSGKVLRRVAFLQAEKRFIARRPENELIEIQMKENEVEIEQERAMKKDTEARQRNR